MSIETITVECEYCRWTGKVKAALEGKRGKCPNCAKVMELIPVSPLEDELTLEEPTPPPAAPEGESLSDNPFAAPQAELRESIRNNGDMYLPDRPEERDILGRTFSAGTQLFKDNWGILVLFTFLDILLGSIDDMGNAVATFTKLDLPFIIHIGLFVFSLIASLYFSVAVAMGLCEAVRNQSKFKPPQMRTALLKSLGVIPFVLIFLVMGSVVAGICAIPMLIFKGSIMAMIVSFAFGAIPMIYLGLAASLGYMLYIDGKCTILESVKTGFSLLSGNALIFLFILILLFIIMISGFFAFIIGALWTIAWTSSAFVCTYIILRDIYFDEPDHIAWLTDK